MISWKNFSKIYKSGFHSSVVAFTKWTETELSSLENAVNQNGPAWSVIASKVGSRNPVECKRRYARLTLDESLKPAEAQLAVHGYEKYDDSWYDFPIENPGESSPQILSSRIKTYKFRRETKKKGWTLQEELTLREAYETFGPKWAKIAKFIRHRTPTQCKNYMERRFVDLNRTE